MARVPRISPRYADNDPRPLVALHYEIEGQVRQWMYTRVTRRAIFARHAASCVQCASSDPASSAVARCPAGRPLGLAVHDSEQLLNDLRIALRELDELPPGGLAPAAPALF